MNNISVNYEAYCITLKFNYLESYTVLAIDHLSRWKSYSH